MKKAKSIWALFIPISVVSLGYMTLVIYLMNSRLVLDTLIGGYPLEYKFKLLTALFEGMWTAMSREAVLLLFINAVLTGVNITFMYQKLTTLKRSGGVKFMIGGSSLIGIVGSGCAACGLPILAFLGLSGSVMALPFQGREISYLSVFFLMLSLGILLRSKQNSQCALESRRA